MLVIQKRTSISIKTRPDKYFTNLILCDGSLRREEVVADPVSKAYVFNRFLSPENSFEVFFARLVKNQNCYLLSKWFMFTWLALDTCC